MALVGRLEDLGMAELFHLLSLFKKSGELRLRHQDRAGVFVFQDGKIVHATADSPRETLGSILVSRELISEKILQEALERQRSATRWRRLGRILVDMGAIQSDVLERIIREQLQDIAEEFLGWATGFFTFKPAEPVTGRPEGDEDDLEISGGMNTDQFILEIITRLDEVGRFPDPDGGEGTVEATADEEPVVGLDEAGRPDFRELLDYMLDPASYSDMASKAPSLSEPLSDFSDLRSLMVEMQLRAPSFTGEITLTILRYASRVVNRGVLFNVGTDAITGIGQFGLESSLPRGEPAARRVRRIRIPTHEPSVFFEVIENMHSYRGPLKRARWNLYLAEQLGGQLPPEVLAIPIVVDGMIIGIFYGDNLPDGVRIGSTHGLELLIIEAGLALEKRLLQAKLKRVEEQVRLLSSSDGQARPTG